MEQAEAQIEETETDSVHSWAINNWSIFNA